MPKTAHPMDGVFELDGGMTLVDIWTGLHSDAAQWHRAGMAADGAQQRRMIRDSSVSLLRELAPCPAQRWHALCTAAGPSQSGAIGLSWCNDAALSLVTAMLFEAVPDPMQLDQNTVSLLAPRHGAAERSLLALLDLASNQLDQLILLVLADPRPVTLDVGVAWLSEVPDVLGKVLMERQDPDDKLSGLPHDLVASWKAA